jgi:hypothetical protein
MAAKPGVMFSAVVLTITSGVFSLYLMSIAGVSLMSGQTLPQSRAERTSFEETSRYDDVMAFVAALETLTPRVRVETFGVSEEGRALPLVVLGSPPVASPDAARAAGLPIVFVMANIHAGEVEGKEALLHLARRLSAGDLQTVLPGAVWLFAPIYNADGNERISVENRPEQHGPVAGVGTRENARGLDLNRDYMKLESSEARALAALFTRWDPHVVVDLHTTNGSYHGYHLTYAPTLNTNADPRVIAFARERLLPSVQAAMTTRHRFRTYYYGNFAQAESLDREQPQFVAESGRTPAWRTFDHRPRFGNNYVGLRNRVAILSEAYSYLDFAGRVRATEAFVEEIVRFVAANARDVRAVTERAEADWLRPFDSQSSLSAGAGSDAGIAFTLRPLPAPVDILVGAVERVRNPRSGQAMMSMVPTVATPTRMQDYGVFAATRTRRVPREYVIAASADRLHEIVAAKLREHGIRVDVTAAASRMTVEQFMIEEVGRAERAFQGHRETSVSGRFERRSVDVPASSLIVGTDQPLGRLVFYLLVPESDDGLGTSNQLDATLKPGAPHPVLKRP